MAEALEGRPRRNGALRSHAKHVREDVNTLQKDIGQLRSDIGSLMALQWSELRTRAKNSAGYVSDQVRTHPLTTLGIAAGAGLLAGLAVTALNSGHDRRR